MYKDLDKKKAVSRAKYLREKATPGYKERRKRHQARRRERANYWYSIYKFSAKDRNIPFSITLEEFSAFWQKPCTYCKAEISRIGLDRINSKLGYTTGNLTPCCKTCNYMKMALPMSKLVEHCRRIISVADGGV